MNDTIQQPNITFEINEIDTSTELEKTVVKHNTIYYEQREQENADMFDQIKKENMSIMDELTAMRIVLNDISNLSYHNPTNVSVKNNVPHKKKVGIINNIPQGKIGMFF